MDVITFIIFAYGLYVAVELVRRVQLLCETEHTQAISPISSSNYIFLYICTLGRFVFGYVLKWDTVGQSVHGIGASKPVSILSPYIEQMSKNHTPYTQKHPFCKAQ